MPRRTYPRTLPYWVSVTAMLSPICRTGPSSSVPALADPAEADAVPLPLIVMPAAPVPNA